MGNPKAENWTDAAGKNPEDGKDWRVCDMVRVLEREGRDPVAGNRRSQPTEEKTDPASEAEDILSSFLKPGQWPRRSTIQRFHKSGQLERVLSLYSQAMAESPNESALPWNLASSLDRLDLSDIALVFAARAVHVAEEVGDQEWAGAHAHLAWADIAIKAGEVELAEVLLSKARRIDKTVPTERYTRKLRKLDSTPSSAPERNEDSARKGTAVEHLIAASCMLASDFKLNVSTTLVDDEGVDLVFHERNGSATLAVQVKSRSWNTSTMRAREGFIAQIRAATFRPRSDLFLLFVAVDTAFGDYGPVWLVPSELFAEKVKASSKGKLRFAASANAASQDRWSAYRLERSHLPGRILEILSELQGPRSASRKRDKAA